MMIIICSICKRGIVRPWWCPVHQFAPQEELIEASQDFRTITSTTATRLQTMLELALRNEDYGDRAQLENFYWRGVMMLQHILETQGK